MSSLDGLYDLAENENIEVLAFSLPATGSVSMMWQNGKCYIGIDPFCLETTSDECVRLAHELGHRVTGSFYNIHAACDVRAKHEYAADKWAIKKLVPEDELEEAVKHGFTESWELSEYFDVTVPFMQKAINYYKEQALGRL